MASSKSALGHEHAAEVEAREPVRRVVREGGLELARGLLRPVPRPGEDAEIVCAPRVVGIDLEGLLERLPASRRRSCWLSATP